MNDDPVREAPAFFGLAIDWLIEDPALEHRLRPLTPQLLQVGRNRTAHSPTRVVITDQLEAMIESVESTAYIVFAEDAEIAAAVGRGAAVLPRSAGAAELKVAIEALLRGLTVLPAPCRELAETRGSAFGELFEEDAIPALSAREFEVLTALAEGASNKLIARQLQISVHTVKFHVASILQKLGASSRTDAVGRAVRFGLLML